MEFTINDGGRAAAGLKGGVSDCVTRAFSIYYGEHAEHIPASLYLSVRADLGVNAPDMDREGIDVFGEAFTSFTEAHRLEFITVPRGVFVRQCPPSLRAVVLTRNHVAAVCEGTLRDSFDCRDEFVQGYWLDVSRYTYNVVDAAGKPVNSAPMTLGAAVAMRRMMQLNYKRVTWII